MKKFTILLITILTINIAEAQVEKLQEYTASNGITYKIGDEIKLGRGSGTNGNFVYVRMTGWAAGGVVLAYESETLAVIKKIKKHNYKKYKKVVFVIGAGNITNYSVDIEDAIKTCEVEHCTKEVQEVKVVGATSDKFDQLKKLKELLDSGVLSQDEFDAEKKKLLRQN